MCTFQPIQSLTKTVISQTTKLQTGSIIQFCQQGAASKERWRQAISIAKPSQKHSSRSSQVKLASIPSSHTFKAIKVVLRTSRLRVFILVSKIWKFQVVMTSKVSLSLEEL